MARQWAIPLFSLLAVISLHTPVSTALVNVTVDDAGTDPNTGSTFVYTPADRWNYGPDCSACTAKPDASLVLDSSWHDATYDPTLGASWNEIQTVSFPFEGSAIYVYGIIARSSDPSQGSADMLFFIDGDQVGSFAQTPSPGDPDNATFTYNALLYNTSSIPNGQHTFALQNGQGQQSSLVLFDYLIYSHDDAALPEPPPPQIPTTSTSTEISSTSAPPITSQTHVSPSPSPGPSSGPSSSEPSSVNTVQSLPPGVSPMPSAHSFTTTPSPTIGPAPSLNLSSSQDQGPPSSLSPSFSSSASTTPVSPADLSSSGNTTSKHTRIIIIACAIVGGVLIIIILASFSLYRRRANVRRRFLEVKPWVSISIPPSSTPELQVDQQTPVHTPLLANFQGRQSKYDDALETQDGYSARNDPSGVSEGSGSSYRPDSTSTLPLQQARVQDNFAMTDDSSDITPADGPPPYSPRHTIRSLSTSSSIHD